MINSEYFCLSQHLLFSEQTAEQRPQVPNLTDAAVTLQLSVREQASRTQPQELPDPRGRPAISWCWGAPTSRGSPPCIPQQQVTMTPACCVLPDIARQSASPRTHVTAPEIFKINLSGFHKYLVPWDFISGLFPSFLLNVLTLASSLQGWHFLVHTELPHSTKDASAPTF